MSSAWALEVTETKGVVSILIVDFLSGEALLWSFVYSARYPFTSLCEYLIILDFI